MAKVLVRKVSAGWSASVREVPRMCATAMTIEGAVTELLSSDNYGLAIGSTVRTATGGIEVVLFLGNER